MIFSLPRASDGVYTVHDEARIPLGECYYATDTDTMWRYVRADVVLAEGEAVKSKLNAGQDALPAAVSAGSHILTDAGGGYNAALIRVPTNGAKFGQNAMIMIDDGAGKGQRGTVLKYTDTELTIYWHGTDDGTLKTALGTDSDYSFAIPWLAEKATAAAASLGFAQVVAEQGQYIWAQVTGLGFALAGAAIGAGVELSIDAAGAVKPLAAGDTVQSVGNSLTPAADGDLVMAILNASSPIGKIPNTGKTGPYIQSYNHPTL